MNTLLIRLSLNIIEFASAVTLLFLALRWALHHVGDGLLSLALEIANLRAKIVSMKKQSAELELIAPERGLSGR